MALSLSQPLLFQALAGKKNVLIAGCGGGYDVYSGIPLFAALKNQGVNVHLANLTFTELDGIGGDWLTDRCVCVRASDERIVNPGQSTGAGRGLNYFPEYYLSKYFAVKHEWDVPIYTIDRKVGARQLAEAYSALVEKFSIDAILCVDGGTDSLMFGDEHKLGTPTEDSTSIAGINILQAPIPKFLICLGFGVDHFHGVSHHLFLENTATLTVDGGFLGAFSLPVQTPEAQMLLDTYDYVSSLTLDSIVCSSVCNAVRGRFGNVQSSQRTASSELYINPLMSMYWCYELQAVANRMPHMSKLMETTSRYEVRKVIEQYRDSLGGLRPAKSIPL
eukprot:scpid60538/ scgid15271/ 